MDNKKLNSSLDYLNSLVENHLIGLNQKQLRKEIIDVRRKAADKKLYVAVIGEFSSGKSTFINALLRMRLLKDAVMPTTACATYIERGKQLCIKAMFNDGTRIQADPNNLSQATAYLNKRFHITATDIQQIIDLLTSEQCVACEVKDLSLTVPAENLPENVVIIDTPGFNPGGEEHAEHFEITRNVVKNIADTALILMPSSQPFSTSIRNFIKTHISRYVKHCVFVLTKMDQQPDESDRDEIIRFVNKHVSINFGIENPKIYGESAISKLPGLNIPPALADTFMYWQRKFDDFESFLWKYVAKQRELIVSEHTKHLALQLIDNMKICLKDKQNKLQEDKKLLEQTKIEHIRQVTDEMQLKASALLIQIGSDIQNDLKAKLKVGCTECQKSAESLVSACNLSKFATDIKPVIHESVNKCISNILEEYNVSQISDFKYQINEIATGLQDDFNAHYSMFPSLAHTVETYDEIKIESLSISRPFLSNTSKIVDDTNCKGGGKIAVGAIGGAAVGMMFGPVGAVIGGLAGFILGGRKSDKFEQENLPLIKQTTNYELQQYFNGIISDTSQQISQMIESADTKFKEYCQSHVDKYGAAVENLIKKHQHKIEVCRNTIANIEQSIRNVEDMRDKLYFSVYYN